MAPEDITHLTDIGDGAQQPQEPTNTEPAAPEVPELPQSYRIGEREYAHGELETKLRIAEDYEKNFAELRREQREAWQAKQRANQIEAEWQQFLATQQPQHQAQQVQPADDDPIAMLRALNSEVRAIKQAAEEERQFFKEQLRQQWVSDQTERVNQAFTGLNTWVQAETERTGRQLPKFTLEELEQEITESGMAQNQRLTWESAMRKAYQNLAWDAAMAAAERAPIERLQNRKAVVTVPGGRGSATPAPAPSDNGLGGMTFGEAREFFPGR